MILGIMLKWFSCCFIMSGIMLNILPNDNDLEDNADKCRKLLVTFFGNKAWVIEVDSFFFWGGGNKAYTCDQLLVYFLVVAS